MASVHHKYLAVSPQDLGWGSAINSVGFQEIGPDMDYPPKNHPSRYLFSARKGRVLNEYQLLYITEGHGSFTSASLGTRKLIPIEPGMMFLLFPGEWHTYFPDRKTGWKEYWIGFQGPFIDRLVRKGFFSRLKPVFSVSLQDSIVALYSEAIEVAQKQESGFQQVLAGIVDRLLSLAYFYRKNSPFRESDASAKIRRAKIMIGDAFATVHPEAIAATLCLSYSTFRKMFKEYTGFSPARYIQEVRMNKAKELLTNTQSSIKEIAFHTGFDNPDYFFTAFRRMTGQTPSEYRTMTQGARL